MNSIKKILKNKINNKKDYEKALKIIERGNFNPANVKSIIENAENIAVFSDVSKITGFIRNNSIKGIIVYLEVKGAAKKDFDIKNSVMQKFGGEEDMIWSIKFKCKKEKMFMMLATEENGKR